MKLDTLAIFKRHNSILRGTYGGPLRNRGYAHRPSGSIAIVRGYDGSTNSYERGPTQAGLKLMFKRWKFTIIYSAVTGTIAIGLQILEMIH